VQKRGFKLRFNNNSVQLTMKIETILSIVIGTILLSTTLFATGSPYANVKLKPIATNHAGQVLFQTFSDVNKEGSYSCTYDKFGWLVVSAYGLWDERVAYSTAEIFDKESCAKKDIVKYEAYKTGKINLKNPDKALKDILRKYYFNRTIKESNERFKVLELKPKQSCFLGKCIEKLLPQKSLDGLVATSLRTYKNSKNLRSSFYYQGVALVTTPFYVEEEIAIFGEKDNAWGHKSLFNLPTLTEGREYSPAYVDSIVFVEPLKFKEHKTSP